jgi:hypothetical protein
MSVAPIPVVLLHVMVLPVVFPIIPVFYDQVMPVGAVLAVVPVVIIMVTVVIDSDLYASLLSFGFNQNQGWCNNGGCQEQGPDISINTSHALLLYARDAWIQNPG